MRTVKLGAKAQRNPTIELNATSTISGIRRPTRSAHNPKMSAPTGRIINVAVVRNATSVFETWKVSAMSPYTSTTMK